MEESVIFDYLRNRTDFEWKFGTLLDIGANDGKTLSNSLALIEAGFEGLLVEASTKAFERLKETHNIPDRQVQLLNVAVGSYDGVIDFNESGELLGTGDVALVSSTRQDEMDRWGVLNIQFKKISVPVITFATLMDRSIYGEFDVVSVDIEGMEPEVIPQIDFTNLRTKIAVIEWNGKNADLYDGLLSGHGLKLIHINQENRIYAK